MEEKQTSKSKELELGARKVPGFNAAQALLNSLKQAGSKLGASSIHIYTSKETYSCYFEVAGRLQASSKKFGDKALKELIDYIQHSTSLGSSSLNPIQKSILRSEDEESAITLLQNTEEDSMHLIVELSFASKPKPLEDLGFGLQELETLKAALLTKKGLIIVDSLDKYASRSFINSALAFLKEYSYPQTPSSLIFDSSQISEAKLVAHDRVFTEVTAGSRPLIESALSLNPAVVGFYELVDRTSLELAAQHSAQGKLVFITTSENSTASALNKVLRIQQGSQLEEIKLVISLSPIQTIASGNHQHQINSDIFTQLESFFNINSDSAWSDIYNKAGVSEPDDISSISLPVADGYSGLTNLVEVLEVNEDIKRALAKNPELSVEAINSVALRAGMLSKRKDGLVKAIKRELDLADVVEACR